MDYKADDTPVYVITSTKTRNEKVVYQNKLLVVQLMDSLSESQVTGKEQLLQPQLLVEDGMPNGSEPHLEQPTGEVGTELEVRDLPTSVSTPKEGAT